MKLTTNESNKPFWINAELGSEFDESLFYEVDMSHPSFDDLDKGPDHQIAFHSNLGSITILKRMTGFGWEDTETGYRDPEGKFWLASGNANVLKDSESKTIGDAIEWIKANANNCKGE